MRSRPSVSRGPSGLPTRPSSRRTPPAHASNTGKGPRHLDAVLDAGAVLVGTQIAAVAQELVNQHPVRGVDLNPIEAGGHCIVRRAGEAGDDAGDLRNGQRTRAF